MAIRWTDELATGHAVVDEQHREIFRRVDTLIEACKSGKGREEVGGMVEFLAEYVVDHFKTEEKLQRESGYPEYHAHKAMHDQFLGQVVSLRERFDAEGPTITMVLNTNRVVVDWLNQHIKQSDKSFGRYLARSR
ncbi:MAG: hemerythrin family protein [Nitrospirae bacterium]|nr:hemerythrin family protein [Nitrospirota bacterium]